MVAARLDGKYPFACALPQMFKARSFSKEVRWPILRHNLTGYGMFDGCLNSAKLLNGIICRLSLLLVCCIFGFDFAQKCTDWGGGLRQWGTGLAYKVRARKSFWISGRGLLVSFGLNQVIVQERRDCSKH